MASEDPEKSHCGVFVADVGTRKLWPGGYVHTQQDGRELYIIERRVGGRRFHRSTHAHTMRAAMRQLERFEADPLGYSAEGEQEDMPLRITAELVSEFYRWELARGVSRKHSNAISNRLAAWMEDLAGVDLRKATLMDHIKPALAKRKTMRGARISTLKAFYGWLRREKHFLRSAEDPTLDLSVPQAQPEKHRRRKAVAHASVEAVAPYLSADYLDILLVMAATGWHFTELERFIRRQDSEVVEASRGDTIAVLVTWHKGKEFTRTPIRESQVLNAAKRLRARGSVPKRPNDALREACKKAGVPEFTFGVMRHTVGTWSVERGALPAQVSEFLNHKDPRTTKRFYIDVAVPTVGVPLPSILVEGKT